MRQLYTRTDSNTGKVLRVYERDQGQGYEFEVTNTRHGGKTTRRFERDEREECFAEGIALLEETDPRDNVDGGEYLNRGKGL